MNIIVILELLSECDVDDWKSHCSVWSSRSRKFNEIFVIERCCLWQFSSVTEGNVAKFFVSDMNTIRTLLVNQQTRYLNIDYTNGNKTFEFKEHVRLNSAARVATISIALIEINVRLGSDIRSLKSIGTVRTPICLVGYSDLARTVNSDSGNDPRKSSCPMLFLTNCERPSLASALPSFLVYSVLLSLNKTIITLMFHFAYFCDFM